MDVKLLSCYMKLNTKGKWTGELSDSLLSMNILVWVLLGTQICCALEVHSALNNIYWLLMLYWKAKDCTNSPICEFPAVLFLYLLAVSVFTAALWQIDGILWLNSSDKIFFPYRVYCKISILKNKSNQIKCYLYSTFHTFSVTQNALV